ncbi:unnamed protein product [Prorocentrum cordatum]|uniref:Uncharacterized protein n=1 Tax=Prorocentrum cordatum TaxID=2364126 RepID=A0ABN9VLC9_9DINO|nr:unnamed protein product [Polarella glacialis]
MFDAVLDFLEGECQDVGIGFCLKTTGQRIASRNFVDNFVLFADGLDLARFMISAVTTLIRSRCGWSLKPDSFELLMEKLNPGSGHREVENGTETFRYAIRSSLVALGGHIVSDSPVQSLMQCRFSAGEKAFYKCIQHFTGKAPVTLKLSAFGAVPGAVACFLCPIVPCTGSFFWTLFVGSGNCFVLRFASSLRRAKDVCNISRERLRGWSSGCSTVGISIFM